MQARKGLLTCLEPHKRGDWTASEKEVETKGLNVLQPPQQFAQAVLWAEDAVRFVV